MMGKLREFIEDRFHWEGMEGTFTKPEMITEVLIIARVVKTDEYNAHGEMPERVQAFLSMGCGAIMAKGMLSETEERMAYDNAHTYFDDDDDGDDDEPSGV